MMWSYEECDAIDSWLKPPNDAPPPNHWPCKRCGTPATHFVEVLPTADPIPLCDDCVEERNERENR